jgi:formylglycine-generating enzyme required for sulfatase activity/transcriptional regulator with XRE-family HTH domain
MQGTLKVRLSAGEAIVAGRQELGTTLRQWRLGARLTQRDLALRIGFHESAVAGVERGERAPSAQYLDGVAQALRLEAERREHMWTLYRVEPRSGGGDAESVAAAAAADAEAVTAESAAPAAAAGSETCPYKGLSAFGEADAGLYYGRDVAVGLVADKLRDAPLVGIVGASGSGKSSAVFAGVLPALRRSGTWDVAAFRPGGDPTAALDAALRESRGGGESLLVVADQFEELFTHGASGGEIDAFLGRLLGLADGADGPERRRVRVLVTFRGDFYGRMVAHRQFSDALQDRVVHLPPMDLAELRQAIVEPARVSGLSLEEGLADRILEEAGTEPGVLPLLEFALTRLWETRGGAPVLTHRGYEQIGRLGGAISARAEEVYGALSPERQFTARQVLVRLVQVARPEEDGNDARRRVAVAELAALPRVGSVIAALADARLAVTDADAAGGPTVELAHEAIIRSWDRLRGWLVEDREFLLWQQRARQWHEEWRLAGGQRAALLRGPILDEAGRWIADKGRDAVAVDLLGYVDASVRAYELERSAWREEQIERLLTTRPADVPGIAEGFADADETLRLSLRERLERAGAAERWRLRAALLAHDLGQADALVAEVGELGADEVVAVRDVLAEVGGAVTGALWERARNRGTSAGARLRIALLLAAFSPQDEQWAGIASAIARALVRQGRLHLPVYVDALRPVRGFLLEPLYDIYADDEEFRSANREVTAAILRDLGADRPRLLARLVADSPLRGGEESFAALARVADQDAVEVLRGIAFAAAADGAAEPERVRVGRRRSAAVATLLRLGSPPNVAELFAASPDPELVAQLARAAPARDVPAEALADLLADADSAAARYALLMALGEYPVEGMSEPLQRRLLEFVEAAERDDPDAGVHAAAGWYRRRMKEALKDASQNADVKGSRAAYDPTGRRSWFTVDVGPTRLTFTVFRPGGFLMGSPADEAGRAENEGPRRPTRITRSFALCRAEVTRGEFESFMARTRTFGLPEIAEWSPGAADPVIGPTWLEAMQFATWATAAAIGKKLGIVYTFGLQEPARSRSFLALPARVGSLRLPTEAEWEYAARSGTQTAFGFGSDRSLLNRYGWFADNSGSRTHEAGLLRPGPTGLFNVHAQCWEWCLDWYAPYAEGEAVDPVGPLDGERKVVRGGSWNLGARYARSAARDAYVPSNRNMIVSFRLAMTVPEIDPAWWPGKGTPLGWTG